MGQVAAKNIWLKCCEIMQQGTTLYLEGTESKGFPENLALEIL